MQFGRHIGKGLWAFADKGLPAVFALGFIFLVARVLPPSEYGAWLGIQNIFLFTSTLGFALALQPLTKFAAETPENGPYIAASMVMSAVFIAVISCLVLVFKPLLVLLLDPEGKAASLSRLFNYLPLLFITAYYRTFAISLLQATYQVEKIFWIDAMYFVGVLVLVGGARLLHHLSNAEDVIILNVVAQGGSTALALLLTRRPMSVKLSLRREAFSKMWHFGKFTFWGSSMYAAFSYMDFFFVSSFAGVVAAATYQVAKQFTRLNDMMSQVIQMFLMPFSSKADAEKNTQGITVVAEKTICFSLLAFTPVFLGLFLFPREILHLLYQGKYDDGTDILRLLSLLSLVIPWNAVVASYLTGSGKVKAGFVSNIFLSAIGLIAYLILTPRYGAIGTAAGFVFTMIIVTVGLVKYMQRFVPLRVMGVLRRTRDAWAFVRSKLKGG